MQSSCRRLAGVSSISIVDEPGGVRSSFSQPQVKTSRFGASSSTNSPRAVCPGMTSQRYRPPGSASRSAGHAHPARRLLRVDEELPDRLRACIDRERPLDRQWSQWLRPCFFLLLLFRFAFEWRRAGRPRTRSRNSLRSASPSGRALYRRLVPLRRSLTSPASLRTFRCWETAGRVTSKWDRDLAGAELVVADELRIWRRRGAAMAFRAASTALYVSIFLRKMQLTNRLSIEISGLESGSSQRSTRRRAGRRRLMQPLVAFPICTWRKIPDPRPGNDGMHVVFDHCQMRVGARRRRHVGRRHLERRPSAATDALERVVRRRLRVLDPPVPAAEANVAERNAGIR